MRSVRTPASARRHFPVASTLSALPSASSTATLGARWAAFEIMCDASADAYRDQTRNTWCPRHGSHTRQIGKLTGAAINTRDSIRARTDRETRTHLPEAAHAGWRRDLLGRVDLAVARIVADPQFAGEAIHRPIHFSGRTESRLTATPPGGRGGSPGSVRTYNGRPSAQPERHATSSAMTLIQWRSSLVSGMTRWPNGRAKSDPLGTWTWRQS